MFTVGPLEHGHLYQHRTEQWPHNDGKNNPVLKQSKGMLYWWGYIFDMGFFTK